MASAPRAAGPPPPALFLTEPVRAAAEWSAFAAAFPVLAATLPRGDGHPVLVLPGFIASDRSTVPLRRLLRRLGYHVHGWRPARHLEPEERRPRLPVPVTAVYTRGDGVVRWQLCVEDDGPRHESVEVRGSHSGLGCNIQAVRVIANRLAQPEGTWAPYRQASDASDRGGRRPR